MSFMSLTSERVLCSSWQFDYCLSNHLGCCEDFTSSFQIFNWLYFTYKILSIFIACLAANLSAFFIIIFSFVILRLPKKAFVDFHHDYKVVCCCVGLGFETVFPVVENSELGSLPSLARVAPETSTCLSTQVQPLASSFLSARGKVSLCLRKG